MSEDRKRGSERQSQIPFLERVVVLMIESETEEENLVEFYSVRVKFICVDRCVDGIAWSVGMEQGIT